MPDHGLELLDLRGHVATIVTLLNPIADGALPPKYSPRAFCACLASTTRSAMRLFSKFDVADLIEKIRLATLP